jgi:LmbE family N-acetylglucosaminyl deacetylase
MKKLCYYYADDKAFSEERLTNLCMWKYGYNEFLPFTWVNHLTEKNLDRFSDDTVNRILEFGFDVMFDIEDNEIIGVHGPNKLKLEKNAENLDLIRSSFKTPTDKLMIIAHPDDEIIFGGQALLEELGWRVVCLTNGRNKIRSEEIESAMHKCGVVDFTVYGLKDRLEIPLDSEILSNILKEEINSKEWKKIVTHNNIGEYGHPHHYQIHNEVKKIIPDIDNLWVFDKSKDRIESVILERKNKILDEIYISQRDIISQIRENRGRWFIDKDMETNYIENGIISRYEESSTKEDEFILCYLK